MATQVTLNSGSVDSAGSLSLKTNGTTTAVTIDTSQNVGIGTASPTVKLDVRGNGLKIYDSGSATANLQVRNSTTGDAAGFTLQQDGVNTLFYNNSNGASVFATNSAERMRIDSSGNVGIGTSSPSSYSFDSGVDLVVGDGTNSAVSIVSSTTGTGYLAFADGTSGTARYSGLLEYSHTSNFLGFRTSATEAMRIDSSGNLLVGTTDAAPRNFTSGFGFQAGAGLFQVAATSGSNYFNLTSASGTIIEFRRQAGTVGNISSNGSNTTYNSTSDYRLKENIAPMTGALAKVAALKPVTYTWKHTGIQDEGFIAHELAEVCPSAVTGEKDAVDENGNPQYQGIDTSFLVATLTAAIQELKALVDTQASTITQLQADVAALKGTA